MLPTPHRLTTRREIDRAVRSGRRAGRPTLVVHLALGPEPTPPRIAFAVSKAVGNSVVRHRVTRRLRALVAARIGDLAPGTTAVIRALPPAATASFAELGADLDSAVDAARRRAGAAPPAPAPSAPAAPEDAEPHDTAPDDTQPAGLELIEGERIEGEWIEAERAAPDPAPAGPPRSPVSQALWIAATPLRWALLGAIAAYRTLISPMLPPSCRFHPSCSAYALQALGTHGVLKGTALASWRLLRCHPWQPGGLDPVPPRGAWRPDVHPDGRPRDVGAIRCTEPGPRPMPQA